MIIGILGGGQLGRMLALAGIPLGMRFRFLDPDPDCPSRHLGEFIQAQYDDEHALARFVKGADVVTYEFENVPAKAARWLTDHIPVFPPEGALATAQDRLAEKSLFTQLGIATPPHRPVDTLDDLLAAADALGIPCILKTRRMGYDGKGQFVIRVDDGVLKAWNTIGRGRGDCADLILEAFIPFQRELSMIGVRARDGATAFYPPIENVHANGILARSTAPAPHCDANTRQALEHAVGAIMQRLDYVGVLTVEFFDLGNGRILANEMAPRVHNSGHWTIEGAESSQFENHLRAVAGLPLGSTAARGQSIMLNIIGAQPDTTRLLSLPGTHLHMYGKSPRPGRKLGHITVCDNPKTAESAAALLHNC
jgi:5-(carboxyamino)imidazole ribonucleotide synthase